VARGGDAGLTDVRALLGNPVVLFMVCSLWARRLRSS
jgi:hypothetical protein